MIKDATFSECRKYRFALWRTWDESTPYALIIGLNPSTADEVENDPTISRCINFAKEWGYGGLCMANLFAYRATKPTELLKADYPVGTDNNKWLQELAGAAGIAVAAWGNDGSHLGRSKEVVRLIPKLHYLKMNLTGEPAHPLYLKTNLKPVPMSI
ncbi:MAG: hypothetical protein DRI97_13435 [Bacteroidetes bacterium]|nr:MAG: hypothetical protein DRI83_02195 [Bacteroidota bacterium]RLD53451.1 MAG: hypothetical protein DRI97_13435 [Bacteroidota bacterium]